MSRPTRRRPERNAGAFLGPDLLVPVPMRTLDEEYRDRAIDLAGSEPEAEVEPEPSGFVHRMILRLTRRSDRGH
ncbi:MAG: hypothetical protein ACJ78H_07905 [Chloroflexota bacterium]